MKLVPFPQRRGPIRSACWLGATAVAVVVGLVAPPAPADAASFGVEGANPAAKVGAFGLGDGLEGLVDEATGALSVSAAVPGVALGWDSRQIGVNRYGFGAGWSVGLTRVDTIGGVRVFPASGGGYEADASHPAGLAGYPTSGVRFDQIPGGQLPARADGVVASTGFAFRLRELGGTTTYFDGAGDPVAQITATGQRRDWVWAPGASHRLERTADESGVVTELVWDDGTGQVAVTRGANLPQPGGTWRIERADGLVAGVVDPEGGRVEYGYANDLLVRVDDPAGARTSVDWSVHDDGVPRVQRLRTADERGVELSARTWAAIGDATVTGWPAVQIAAEAGAVPRATELGDGQTVLRAEYGPSNTVRSRTMLVRTSSGERELQTQQFGYAGGDAPSTPGDAAAGSPSRVEVTQFDGSGGRRSAAEQLRYDEFGRVVGRVQADGTRVEAVYDEVRTVDPVTGVLLPPLGLPVRETTTTPDGLVTETRHTLTEDRTRVVATEQLTGTAGSTLTPVGLDEYTVEGDGFVTEQRSYPGGDRAEPPVATRHTRRIDLTAGIVRTTDTAAAGAPLATTTSHVVSLAHGGVLEAIDVLGHTATTEYDRLGRVVTQTSPDGSTTTAEYESWQADGRNAVTVTGPDQVATTEISDALGRLSAVQDNIDHGTARPGYVRVAETRTYPAPGVVDVTDAWGATTRTEQDVLGRTVRTTAPGGMVAVTEHDDVAGTTTSGLTPTGDLTDAERTTTEHHDPTGRAVKTTGTRTDGVPVPAAQAEFDGLGRPTTATTDTFTTTWGYDAAGNPITTTRTPTDNAASSTPVTSTRRFNPAGQSLEKVLAGGDTTSTGGARDVDALGRTTAQRDQHGKATTYTYTPDGLIAAATQPGGRSTGLEYHPVTRHLTAAVVTADTGTTVATAYENDPVTGLPTAVFDPEDPNNTRIEYEHDAFGNTTVTRYPDGNTITHDYDQHGRLERTTDITGNTTDYRYTPEGLLAEAVQQLADGGTAHVAYTYDRHGRVIRLNRGNSSTTSYAYTSAGQIATETTTHTTGRRSERRYTYEPGGNLLERTDITSADGVDTATTTAYEYDAFDHLTSSTIHDGDATDAPVRTSTSYESTLAGNLARETSTDHATDTIATRVYAYTAASELTTLTTTTRVGDTTEPVVVATTLDYDSAGNLTRDLDGTTYTYDATGKRITSTATDGSTTHTGYWADGTRRQHTTTSSDGSTDQTRFYWAGDTLTNETHTRTEASTPPGEVAPATAAYLLGAGRHARTTPTGTVYYDSDRHGNILNTTNAVGDVVDAYTYTDFGTTTASTATGSDIETSGIDRNPYRYAGEYTDPDTTQPLGTRTYHSGLRQFSTPDTAALHNRRAFADLNPIMNVDPTGTTANPDEVFHWVSFGVSLIAGVISAVALSSLPVGGAAITLYTIGAIGAAADYANLGITIAHTIKTYQPDWISPAIAADLNSDALTIASYTLTAAAAPAAATALLQHGATQLERARRVKVAREAFEASSERVLARETAARLTKGKTGSEKFYYHGSDFAFVIAGREGVGFDSTKAFRGLYGPGTYSAKRITTAEGYGANIIRIQPNLETAIKVDVFGDDLYRIRNPRWTKAKSAEPAEPKFTSDYLTLSELETYRQKWKIQGVYIKRQYSQHYSGSGWSGYGHALEYLRVPDANPGDGIFTKERLWILPEGLRKAIGRWERGLT